VPVQLTFENKYHVYILRLEVTSTDHEFSDSPAPTQRLAGPFIRNIYRAL